MVGLQHLTHPGWSFVASRRVPHAFVLLVAVLALLLGTLACVEENPKEVSIVISCEEFQQNPQLVRTMTVAPDDTITVTLCSNPSTGFAWEQATISNTAVLGLSDQRFVQPQTGTPIVGAAGQERWQFDVRASGTATVDFRYSQPWDGGTKNAWTLTLRVTASS